MSEKIMIIGHSGSGKSTLAENLANKYNLPLLHLDKVQFLSGWKERSIEEQREILEKFLNENSSWVIDGNYTRNLYERRLEDATKIIYLNFNRFSSLFRVIKRFIKYKGKSRSSITEGCDEKIDFDFFNWIMFKGRSKEKIKRYKGLNEKYPEKFVEIKNQRQLNRYYKENGIIYEQ